MAYTGYLASLVVSLIVAIALAGFFWVRRPAPGATSAVWLTGAVIVSLIAYILEQLTIPLAESQFVDDFLYIGLVSGPVFWFIFILHYVRYDSWLTHHLYLLWIIPSITLILTFTNNLHGLIWTGKQLESYAGLYVVTKTYGWWFIVHAVYSYGLGIAGITILALRAFSPIRLYRTQIIILSVGLIIPFIWNILFIFRAPPAYQIDLTPQAFIISGLILTLGLFRFKLLDIMPVARSTLVENLNDGVLVLDQQNRIVDLNRAAQDMLGHSISELIGQPADIIWKKNPEIKSYFLATEVVCAEVVWDTGKQGDYELNIIPLYDKKHRLNGRLVILHDMTKHKQMEQALESYARRITQVQEEERQRVARELHDDTAQALAILSLEIDSLAGSKEITSPVIKEKLTQLRNDADRAMQDVRRYSHELRPGILDYLGLQAALEQLASDSDGWHELKVDFEFEGNECRLSDEAELAYFRIAQEALNNSRKHSQATRVTIFLGCLPNKIKLMISDNGKGFDLNQLESAAAGGHLGLIGMEERAQLIGALLNIESAPGRGTTITVEMNIQFSPTQN